MADEEQVFRGINWRQALPFTHLFRTFRIAIHPSKLVLALVLVLAVYLGGVGLDGVWPNQYRAVPDEVTAYITLPLDDFSQLIRNTTDRQGLFRTFFNFESHEFVGVVNGVIANQWFESSDTPGVVGHIGNFVVHGPLWLMRMHSLFAATFAILFLCAWSIFGGAISRLAAVQVAREEKISVRQAIYFSSGKFLSFASAPIIPAMIVAAVGLLLAAAALLGNIPFLGPIAIGAGFCFALLAGLVMTLVILGGIGGFNLMYPTIAVEGSDSFDAISRSFSYVYGRPWRMLFYTAVAVGYGALTYVFVRYFILLMLISAHHFVAMGMFSGDTIGRPLLPVMWPSPASTGRFTFTPDYAHLTGAQSIGAGFLVFWIYLVIGFLGAYAVSFYFSANTIIYLLMRREIDATEMDEVYLEQAEEEFGNPVPGGEPAVDGEMVVVEAVATQTTSQSPPTDKGAGDMT